MYGPHHDMEASLLSVECAKGTHTHKIRWAQNVQCTSNWNEMKNVFEISFFGYDMSFYFCGAEAEADEKLFSVFCQKE